MSAKLGPHSRRSLQRPMVMMTCVVETAAASHAAKANMTVLTSLDRGRGIAVPSDHMARACAEKLIQAATQRTNS